MFATRSTLMVALVVVALAVSSEALFGHKKNKNNQVVTQYVPVPTAQQGYYVDQGHQDLHYGGHHQHGHHAGHHGGASSATAVAGPGGSASATAIGGGSASATSMGGANDYYYPEAPMHHAYHPPGPHYEPAPIYHHQQQPHSVQSVGPAPACIAPCYGGLVQQAPMMPTEKPKRGLFGKKKPAAAQTPMIVQQQYINNVPHY